ncbi:MAG: hypothetical protein KJO36_02145 [Acidimicrobiia bacterium]|nr:hypothetical protein [Acidimicrobiia bacterium]
MPFQNMVVLLLGLVLVISGFYVAWNAPQEAAPTSTIQNPSFIIAVEGFDCEVGSFSVRGGRLTDSITIVDENGSQLPDTNGVVTIPNWETSRSPVTVRYSWAGDPGSQTVDPASHCMG